MVELRCSVVSVAMVVGGRGAAWCRPPAERRSGFDPCMPGYFGVDLYSCGLFAVGSPFLQRFRWCMVVLAALRSAFLPLGLSRCSRRWRSRMLSLLSSRLFLGFVAAGLSDAVFIVLRPGRWFDVVVAATGRLFVGLCGGPYGPGRLR